MKTIKLTKKVVCVCLVLLLVGSLRADTIFAGAKTTTSTETVVTTASESSDSETVASLNRETTENSAALSGVTRTSSVTEPGQTTMPSEGGDLRVFLFLMMTVVSGICLAGIIVYSKER